MAMLQGNSHHGIGVGGHNPGLEGGIGIHLDHEGIELGFRHGRWEVGEEFSPYA